MTRVLIVDDSAVARAALRRAFEGAADLEVVGTAATALVARDMVRDLHPDVITLDVEMPGMDGLTFLRKLMAWRFFPVVMVSSATSSGASATMEALGLGAVDFVTKPGADGRGLDALAEELVAKVRGAAELRAPPRATGVDRKIGIGEVLDLRRAPRRGAPPVIVIGASTGGPPVIEQLLTHLRADLPPIAIVQHMPAGFTRSFAERIDARSPLTVREAETGLALSPGMAVIAPGGRHLFLQQANRGYRCEVKDAPPVNRHRPSVDVLFRSAVNVAGDAAVGVLLTGMGDDGARGLKDLHDAGALTVAQDEASSLVYGMPKVAAELGAARMQVSPAQLPELLARLFPA